MDEFLVSQLSSKAGRLLFALLVTREVRQSIDVIVLSVEEMAARSGLSRQSVYVALDELITGGYITKAKDAITITVPLSPGPPPVVPETPSSVEPVKPEDPMQEAWVRCEEADKRGDGRVKIDALKYLWDSIFPEDKYPYQRLQDQAARGLLQLADGSALQVYEVLSSGVQGKEIKFPKAYSEHLLKTAKKKKEREVKTEEVIEGITDQVRALAQLGNEYGNQKFKRRFE